MRAAHDVSPCMIGDGDRLKVDLVFVCRWTGIASILHCLYLQGFRGSNDSSPAFGAARPGLTGVAGARGAQPPTPTSSGCRG